jgi:hypothetical protein
MINKHFRLILTVPLLAGALAAQPPKNQAILMAVGANARQMGAYQWKQKTTILRNGSPAGYKIDELHFDAAGQLERVTLAQPEEKRMGPLMAKRARAVKSDVQEVMQLTARYANPQQLGQAIQRGEVWEGPGTLRLQARSVVLPGDEMVMTVNPRTYLPSSIHFKTQHDGNPVSIAIDYEQLPDGPSMIARMTVQIPEDDIVVNVQSYDYVRLAGPIIR